MDSADDRPEQSQQDTGRQRGNGDSGRGEHEGGVGRTEDQQATLRGLGLNKRHRSRVLEDTPSVRGMINKVRHLVRIDEDAR